MFASKNNYEAFYLLILSITNMVTILFLQETNNYYNLTQFSMSIIEEGRRNESRGQVNVNFSTGCPEFESWFCHGFLCYSCLSIAAVGLLLG